MILSVRINNYMVFSEDVSLSFHAEEKIERFEDNVHTEGNFSVLKSACVYGGNNSGKTCLINAIKSIRDVILNRPTNLHRNFYNDNHICSLGISFLRNGHAYSYDFKYDSSPSSKNTSEKRGYIYECFKELGYAENGEENGDIIFLRDVENNTYQFDNDRVSKDAAKKVNIETMDDISTNNIFIYVANTAKYEGIARCKDVLVDFAKSIDIIDTNHVSYKKTTLAMANKSPLMDKIVELIKKADLSIDSFEYETPEMWQDVCLKDETPEHDSEDDDDKYLTIAKSSLWTIHHSIAFNALATDSVGTNKIIAMAGYIIDALENGRTLVIDEFDSGLHFKLTRALVLLFNNDSNDRGGQLFFSTHDVMLLDCERIFRQDQIYFVCRDEKTEYLYSLSDLGYPNNEVTSNFDLIDKYVKGALGIIPRPDFISLILPGIEVDDDE